MTRSSMSDDEKAAQQSRLISARKMVEAANEAIEAGMSGQDAMAHVDKAVDGSDN